MMRGYDSIREGDKGGPRDYPFLLIQAILTLMFISLELSKEALNDVRVVLTNISVNDT